MICLYTIWIQADVSYMEHLKFLIKVNNAVGYVLIATIVLSPIGFIQVLLGNLVMMVMEGDYNRKSKSTMRNKCI